MSSTASSNTKGIRRGEKPAICGFGDFVWFVPLAGASVCPVSPPDCPNLPPASGQGQETQRPGAHGSRPALCALGTRLPSQRCV